jgi:hypothetical protein
MKKIMKQSTVITGLLMTFSLILFSFTVPFGGDNFTIKLNDKLVLQQYLHLDKTIKTLSLEGASSNDELKISFSHCGEVGKARVLTIKDENDKILKQWRFENSNETMTCKVKEILSLGKGHSAIKLCYSSSELPKGQVLASIKTEKVNNSTRP